MIYVQCYGIPNEFSDSHSLEMIRTMLWSSDFLFLIILVFYFVPILLKGPVHERMI